MRAHLLRVRHDFRSPPDTVFDLLSDHEKLTAIFPARIARVRDGEDGRRDGVGSVRRLSGPGGLGTFEETVTRVIPGELIVYRITKGSPLRGHEGTMRLSARPDGGTHLDYTIRLASPVPGLAALVKALLARTITRGLPRLEVQA